MLEHVYYATSRAIYILEKRFSSGHLQHPIISLRFVETPSPVLRCSFLVYYVSSFYIVAPCYTAATLLLHILNKYRNKLRDEKFQADLNFKGN